MQKEEQMSLFPMGRKYWWLNDESLAVLNRGYLLHGETVEDAVKRITKRASEVLKKPELQPLFEEMIANGWLSLSSPVWANLGTSKGLPISCFSSFIPDSISDISDKVSEVIMQTKIGGGTSGYFGELRGRGASITNNGKSSGAVSFMELFDTIMSVVSQGCYSEDVEVLTNKGFKLFKNLTEQDLVAQVNEDSSVIFVKPLEFFKYKVNENLIRFKDYKNIDILVTKNHNMVFKSEVKNKVDGKFIRKVNPVFKIKEALDIKLHRDNKFLNSSFAPVENRIKSLSFKERLLIAFQADGGVVKRNEKALRFRFKKQRKKERLEWILKNCNYNYTYSYYEKDKTHNFYIVLNEKPSKTLNWVSLENKNYKWCQEFLEEVCFWGGSIRKKGVSFIYSSIVEENVDIIQSVSSICGYKSRKSLDLRLKEKNKKPIFNIFLSKGEYFNCENIVKKEEFYNGFVYCVEVPSNKIIVRSNGHTLVCGNSTRRGSFASYLDIDHPDIEEFLQIKDIGHPIQNLFYGVCVPDYWLHEMINGDSKKRDLWAKVLESRQQKGLPYIFFTDNVNKSKPEIYKYLDMKIHNSNLCSEIALPTSKDESFVCCLASMNLELYNEWKDTKAVQYAIWFLDAVLSDFIENTKDEKHLQTARNFAIRHRAIGLGTMALHSYYQKMGRPFGHPLNIGLNNAIFSHIRSEAEKASRDLAKEYGVAPIFNEVGNDFPESEKKRNTTLLAIAP